MFDEFGNRYIDLTIDVGAGGGRAMTADLARAGIDFYEASFQIDNVQYRTSWDYTQKGRIRLPVPPAGTPFAAGAAATLLAGRQSDKTLLAIGLLTEVNGVVGTTVTQTTTSVTFTLQPILVDVHGRPWAGVPAQDSSFLITAPSTHTTETAASGTSLPNVRITTQNVPVFRIPAGQDTSRATYTVRFPSGVQSTDMFDGVRIANAPTVLAGTAGGAYPYVYTSGATGTMGNLLIPVYKGTLLTTINNPQALNAVFSGSIMIAFDTQNVTEGGLAQIAVEIPVTALHATNGSPITWFIRGGLVNGILDEGANANSLGGSICIGIGNIEGIDINTTWPTP